MHHPNRDKTHCKHGHPYDEANTYRTKAGHRQCRTCRAARARAPKAELLRQRTERRMAQSASRRQISEGELARTRQRLQERLERANQKALEAVIEAKRIAEQVAVAATPRLCKRGHPLDPAYRGCKECSKQFLRRKAASYARHNMRFDPR